VKEGLAVCAARDACQECQAVLVPHGLRVELSMGVHLPVKGWANARIG